MSVWLRLPLALCVLGWLASGGSAGAAAPSPWSGRLEAAAPGRAAECGPERAARCRELAAAVDRWAGERTWDEPGRGPAQRLAALDELLATKSLVDRLLDRTFAFRAQVLDAPPDQRLELARSYLQIASTLIDLSGRLRYTLRDAVDRTAYHLEGSPSQLASLLDLLARRDSSVGAAATAYVLFDPPAGSGEPFPLALKEQQLKLIASTGATELLPVLAELARDPATAPPLALAAGETMERLGLPQPPPPGSGPEAAPPATAEQLARWAARWRLPPGGALDGRRTRLVRRLQARGGRGPDEPFRFGRLQLRPGDWLLMRNPSPYNRFTSLAPGLFTHVGVVAAQRGTDGVRRIVVVDLPERGRRIPATNVETYLERTLHYVFLRHEDPETARRMGQAAADLIGNECVFDLTFRTSRVAELRGQPLRGKRIRTYCAGLLLLCGQAAGCRREDLFPLPEGPGGGNLAENLALLGLSIGDEFVSPTGALFSSHMRLVARRPPMYSPGREVAEAVYDAFAELMIRGRLRPAPDWAQQVRQRVAELASERPWLAQALASLEGVHPDMDLAAAAKAAAVVEILDQIANRCASDLFYAREAILAGPLDRLAAAGAPEAQLARIRRYRERHAALRRLWTDGRLTPRQLRIALVQYYSQRGREELKRRLFGGPSDGAE